MNKSLATFFGITSVLIFVITTIIAGYLYPNYNHLSQFISESYAVDAPYADPLRFYGYIPSGVFFLLFCFFSNVSFPNSALKTISFLGVATGYGFGTIICAVFNCDAGCNPEFVNPSLSQFTHNLSGMFTYLIVPFSILCFGIASRKWHNSTFLSNWSLVLAVMSFVFVILLNQNLDSNYKGLIQRIIEGSILLWIAMIALASRKSYQQL